MGFVVGGEASSRVELCLEMSPSFLYVEGEPPALDIEKVGSKKRTLSSLTVLIKETK